MDYFPHEAQTGATENEPTAYKLRCIDDAIVKQKPQPTLIVPMSVALLVKPTGATAQYLNSHADVIYARIE